MGENNWIPSIKDIDLIVYDFDGVMTDNTLILLQDGTEGVVVSRADGFGVDLFRSSGVPQIILSTETNPVVEARGRKLKIEVIGSCSDKEEALKHYCAERGYDLQKVIYIGNDLNDLEVMKVVGFPVATCDANPVIKSIAKLVTKTKGGRGVVRELAGLLIDSN